MFKCFRPDSGEADVRSSVLLELKRGRDAAEHQANALRKQLDQAAVQQQSNASQLREQREQAAHWQRLCESKAHALIQLLHECQGLSSSLEGELLHTYGVQATVLDDEATGQVVAKTRSSHTPDALDGRGGDAGADLDVVSPGSIKVPRFQDDFNSEHDEAEPPAPEVHVQVVLRKLDKQHASALQAFKAQAAQLDTITKQAARLETQLTVTRQSKEQAELAAKNQLMAFDVERAALESGAATLTELNAELTAQLEAAQAALTTATAARAAASESELRGQREAEVARETAANLQLEAAQARKALELASKEVGGLAEQLAAIQKAAEDDKRQLAEATSRCAEHQAVASELAAELTATRSQLSDIQAAATAAEALASQLQVQVSAVEAESSALKTQLAGLQVSLETSQAEAASLRQQLTTSQASLADSTREVHSLRERVAQAEGELCTSQAASAASASSLLTTKRELVTVRQQLAEVARNHGAALNSLGGTDEALAAATRQLEETSEALASTQKELGDAIARAATSDAALASVQDLLADTTTQLGGTTAAAGALTAMSAAVATLGDAPVLAGVAVSSEERDALRAALAQDSRLSLQLATVPLSMIAALASDEQVRGSLAEVSVEVDMGAAEAPDQVLLRAACLASALSQCTCLTHVTLSGWAWGGAGEGLGVAGPFIALAALLQARHMHAASSEAPVPAACVQIDTQLIGPACGRALVRLLSTEALQLCTAPGQPGLLLYADHEQVDGWYREMLGSSPHGAVSRVVTAAALAAAGSSSEASHRSGGSAASGTTRAHSVRHGQAPHLVAPAAPSTVGGMSLVRSTSQRTSPATTTAGGLSSHPSGSGLQGAVDCELVSLGLASHHMALVTTVLVTCPHVRRLKLDANKVGDAGAALLALGLPHASGLRDLTLTRNALTREGVRVLAVAITACASLKKLDLGEQRAAPQGPQTVRGGLPQRPSGTAQAQPPMGVEVLVSVLRAGGAPALQDLGLAGLMLGEQGANALATLIASGHPLRRLVVSSQGAPQPALVRLQAAAAGKPGLVLNVV